MAKRLFSRPMEVFLLGSSSGFDATGTPDPVVLKLDSTGNLIWSKWYGANGGQIAVSISEFDNRDILVAANEQQFITRGVLMRLDSFGNIIWQRQIHYDSQSQYAEDAINQHSLGNNESIFLAGANDPNAGEEAIFAKMSPDGITGCNSLSETWQAATANFPYTTAIGPIINDVLPGPRTLAPIILGLFDSTYCSSNSCNFQAFGSYTALGNNNVQFNASATGAVSWFWDFGDSTTSTQQNPQHAYQQSGIFTVCAIATTMCSSDTICMQVNIITTSIPEEERYQFSIWPNPASENIYIGVPADITRVQLLDAAGRVLIDRQGSLNTQEEINVSGVAEGFYIVRLTGLHGIAAEQKLIITRQ